MNKPFIIGIGGVKSSSGKTTVASAILKLLTDKGFLSVPGQEDKSSHQPDSSNHLISNLKSKKRWGAIKYTNSEFYSSIVDAPEILNESGKDTQRFIEAGAEEVLWVQSPSSDMHEVMPIAIDRLYHLEGILIEGNSAIELAKPDIIVLVSIGGSTEIKPSAWKILANANIIIMSDNSPLIDFPDRLRHCKIFTIENFEKTLQIHIIKEVIDYMDKFTDKNKKKIVDLLIERSIDRRISCADARKIAEEIGMPYSEVGRLANDLQIKIGNCELGCF